MVSPSCSSPFKWLSAAYWKKSKLRFWSWPNQTFQPCFPLNLKRTSSSSNRNSIMSQQVLSTPHICSRHSCSLQSLSSFATCQIPILSSRSWSNATSFGKTKLGVWSLTLGVPVTLWITLVTFTPFCWTWLLCLHLPGTFVFSLFPG
jgi:hypothetical protein